MTTEELRAIMDYLRERVKLRPQVANTPITIDFKTPSEQEMIDVGLNAIGVNRILRVPWWEEMVMDIIETPELCDPEDSPEEVLGYAKDIVSEYIRKRFPLNEE